MSRVRLILVICSTILLAVLAFGRFAAPAVADSGSRVVASTTGGIHWTNQNLPVHLSYSALLHEDGSASGQYEYYIGSLDMRIHGHVTCLVVRGNRAWIGGIADNIESDHPTLGTFLESLEGKSTWWQVADNGEGSNDPPDRSTSVGVEVSGTVTDLTWCRDTPEPITFFPVEDGNLQVRDKR